MEVATQPDLFAAPRERAPRQHDAEVALLLPVLRAVAQRNTDGLVTVDDLRTEAARRGLLKLKGKGRELAWIFSVPRAAVRAGWLIDTGRKVRSTIEDCRGNWRNVYQLKAAA